METLYVTLYVITCSKLKFMETSGYQDFKIKHWVPTY